jgi:hypothetical protein
VVHGVASGYSGKELLGRFCMGSFWAGIYWARSIHEETPTLALETNGAAVEEAHEVAKSCSLKSRSRIRGLWLQVAGLDGDAPGSGKEENACYGWTAPYRLWQTLRELNPASLRAQLQH